MKTKKPQNIASKKASTVNVESRISTADMAKQRRLSHLKEKLLKNGVSESKIEKLCSTKTVTIIPYGSLKITAGTRTVKRGKSKKEVEVPNILCGARAIEYIAKENGFDTIAMIGSHWIHIEIKDADTEKVLETFAPHGRVYIYNWQIGECINKAVKNKKPTTNTNEKKKAAKKRRKDANVNANEKRAYYAALRKGGVSKRIKRHNKVLAEKIQNWLKEKRAKDAIKAEYNKKQRAIHRQLTTAERKADKKAKKIAKMMEMKAKKAAQQSKPRTKKTQPQQKEQKLSFAA